MSAYNFNCIICYSTKLRKDHIMDRMESIDTSDIKTHHPHVPPIFVVQMQIPTEAPSSLFSSAEDGPGWAIIMYFKITEV